MKEDFSETKVKALTALIGVLIVCVIYTVFFGALKKYENSLYFSRTFNVTAEANVTISPDIAKVSFSVVSEGRNPSTLAEDNNKKINVALEMLKTKGVDEKDIKTTGYNLSPRYEYDEITRRTYVSGYTMTQTVSVKIRALDKAAEILGALPDSGVNQISSISFEIDEPDKYLAEAREEASAKAAAKAEEIAKANNFKVGKLVSVYENRYGGGPIPYYNESMSSYYGAGGGSAVDAAKAPAAISPGTTELTVSLNVTYEIR